MQPYAKPSVAGRTGARTEGWRTLSFELGDRAADVVCAWADRCADPDAALSGALSVVQLADPDCVGDALNVYMLAADAAAYAAALTAEGG